MRVRDCVTLVMTLTDVIYPMVLAYPLKGTQLPNHLEDQTGNTGPEKREEDQEKIAKIALSRL